MERSRSGIHEVTSNNPDFVRISNTPTLRETLFSRTENIDDFDMVQNAYRIAEIGHAGQVRNDGTPFINHVIRVSIRYLEDTPNATAKEVATCLLHESLEDMDILTEAELGRIFGDDVRRGVRALSSKVLVTGERIIRGKKKMVQTDPLLPKYVADIKACDEIDNALSPNTSEHEERNPRVIKTQKHPLFTFFSPKNPVRQQKLVLAYQAVGAEII